MLVKTKISSDEKRTRKSKMKERAKSLTEAAKKSKVERLCEEREGVGMLRPKSFVAEL